MPRPTLSPHDQRLLTALLSHERPALDLLAVTGGSGIGRLYVRLYRLEARGLITSRWGEETPPERHGLRRRYYALTPVGVQALEDADA